MNKTNNKTLLQQTCKLELYQCANLRKKIQKNSATDFFA